MLCTYCHPNVILVTRFLTQIILYICAFMTTVYHTGMGCCSSVSGSRGLGTNQRVEFSVDFLQKEVHVDARDVVRSNHKESCAVSSSLASK